MPTLLYALVKLLTDEFKTFEETAALRHSGAALLALQVLLLHNSPPKYLAKFDDWIYSLLGFVGENEKDYHCASRKIRRRAHHSLICRLPALTDSGGVLPDTQFP